MFCVNSHVTLSPFAPQIPLVSFAANAAVGSNVTIKHTARNIATIRFFIVLSSCLYIVFVLSGPNFRLKTQKDAAPAWSKTTPKQRLFSKIQLPAQKWAHRKQTEFYLLCSALLCSFSIRAAARFVKPIFTAGSPFYSPFYSGFPVDSLFSECTSFCASLQEPAPTSCAEFYAGFLAMMQKNKACCASECSFLFTNWNLLCDKFRMYYPVRAFPRGKRGHSRPTSSHPLRPAPPK